jgi:hypothetical protein
VNEQITLLFVESRRLPRVRPKEAMKAGSYVRSVKLKALVSDPLARRWQLIDAQGRRQDEWTTVDPALIRGLTTA